MRALEKDPKTRFASVSEFAVALLKFAPKKARTNVERITKLQRQAGVSQILPQMTAIADSAPGLPVEKRRYDATITGFGHSVAGFDTQNRPEIPTNRVGKWIAIGAVGLVVILGGLALAFFTDSETADQPPPVGPVQASAPSSITSAQTPAVVSPPKPTEVRPLEEVKAEPEPKPAPVATAKPETSARPAPKKPLIQQTQPSSVGKPIIIVEPRPAAQPAATPAPAKNNDSESPFGGRK
jgi:predicted ribosomally synthesized peptide with SipW-like signal peptide